MYKLTPLTRARLDRGWKLIDVRDRTGIDVSQISRIERGQSYPRKANLEQLLDLFPDLDADAILFPEGRQGQPDQQ